MSRINPHRKRRLLYLGEIPEPPRWLPPNVQSTIKPIIESSRVGVFTLENPSPEEVRYLERAAQESSGVVTVFRAGGTDFCTYIGSRSELCERRPGEVEAAMTCEDFVAAVGQYSARHFTLTFRGGTLTLGDRTRIMGILNVTPDSFSDGGRFHNFDAAIAHAEKMAEEGADIIDVGGESTRPGADTVPVEEEAKRVLPVVEHLSKNLSIPVSIDTCKAEIARRALDAGAEIVNDVSALRFDEKMIEVVRDAGCPLILMHMLDTPKIMQRDPRYDALMPEIISFLQERIDYVLQERIEPEQVIVDPGVGFGKTVEHNLEVLRELGQLRSLGRPILVGPSRKATIGKVLEAEVSDRIEGTASAVAIAIANGVHVVRVHDVKEMARVVKMSDAIMGRQWN
jgi:dihydropteroate synthase